VRLVYEVATTASMVRSCGESGIAAKWLLVGTTLFGAGVRERLKLAHVSEDPVSRARRRSLRYTLLSRPRKTRRANESERLAMSWDPVYQLIKTIPRGQVTTYGLLARALKIRGGARTVGHAMAATPSGRGIPWHRVVAAGGRLIIREPIASKQRKLLESEGVPMHSGRVDISSCLWTPASARAKRAKKASPKTRTAPKR